MNIEEFYLECARLLKTDHLGQPFTHYKRTRWNNRSPGQGRFPGRGIIRAFGDQVHIALNNPPLHKICKTKEECLETLRSLDFNVADK